MRLNKHVKIAALSQDYYATVNAIAKSVHAEWLIADENLKDMTLDAAIQEQVDDCVKFLPEAILVLLASNTDPWTLPDFDNCQGYHALAALVMANDIIDAMEVL